MNDPKPGVGNRDLPWDEGWKVAQGDRIKLRLDFLRQHRTLDKSLWKRLIEIQKQKTPRIKTPSDELNKRCSVDAFKRVATRSREGVLWADFVPIACLIFEYLELPATTTFGELADNHQAQGFEDQLISASLEPVEADAGAPPSDKNSAWESRTQTVKGILKQPLLYVCLLLALALAWTWSELSRLRSIDHPLQIVGELGLDQPPQGRVFASQFMGKYDTDIFYGSDDGVYNLARIVVNRDDLIHETDIVADIKNTKASFDALTNVGGVYKENIGIIEEGIKRGVHVRIVLSDYRESNKRLGLFLDDVGEGGREPAANVLRIVHKKLDELMRRIEADHQQNSPGKRTYEGSLAVKWNPKLLLYTMWIRDGRTETGAAHLGVHYYEDKTRWPYFRFSGKSAPGALKGIQAEFDHIWHAQNGVLLDYETIALED